MPRGTTAGKKIGWRDAVQTVWTLFRWRLQPLADLPRISMGRGPRANRLSIGNERRALPAGVSRSILEAREVRAGFPRPYGS